MRKVFPEKRRLSMWSTLCPKSMLFDREKAEMQSVRTMPNRNYENNIGERAGLDALEKWYII
jgi:hypothetical protein